MKQRLFGNPFTHGFYCGYRKIEHPLHELINPDAWLEWMAGYRRGNRERILQLPAMDPESIWLRTCDEAASRKPLISAAEHEAYFKSKRRTA
jgi:hypothetical protein